LFLVVIYLHDQLPLLGTHDDGLAVHSANHVKRFLRFAPQSQLQNVLLDAFFD
tara:strand:- start:113 stop:271 length:159 start_codon:yes stop_codon:yes gene_type:complete